MARPLVFKGLGLRNSTVNCTTLEVYVTLHMALRAGSLCDTVLGSWPQGCDFNLGSQQLLSERDRTLSLTLADKYDISYITHKFFNCLPNATNPCTLPTTSFLNLLFLFRLLLLLLLHLLVLIPSSVGLSNSIWCICTLCTMSCVCLISLLLLSNWG